jgi:hypothetical protein
MGNSQLAAADVREMLSSRERALEAANGIFDTWLSRSQGELREGVQETFGPDAAVDEVSRWVDALSDILRMVVTSNIETVFDCAESPIEQLFLGSLVLGFLVVDPPRLNVTPPPPGDALVAIQDRMAQIEQVRAWDQQCVEGDRLLADFFAWLVEEGDLTQDEARYWKGFHINYFGLGMYESWHATLQAPLPGIVVDGKGIRVDMLLWRPSHPDTRLVIECDGYQFHSSSEMFIRDRKRDRALRAAGFDVLRYSGSEIWSDPLAASADLFRYLTAHEPDDPPVLTDQSPTSDQPS